MSAVSDGAQPTVLIPAHTEVGEGPVLDPRTGELVWVDITRGELRVNDLASGAGSVVGLGTMLGAAVPRAARPGYAVAVAEGYGFVVDGLLELTTPDLADPTLRSNDAKCDSRGRLWAGSNDLEFVPGRGQLRVWTGDGPSRVAADGFTLPNGIGWSPDDTRMYLVDSMTHLLHSAPFDADAGTVGEFTPLAEVGQGLPDGLAVDTEGCVWVAIWGGWQLQRFSPAGELLERVVMPVSQPSSCAFAADGTLIITSASAGLDDAARAAQPLAGSVFELATTVRGVPVASFAG